MDTDIRRGFKKLLGGSIFLTFLAVVAISNSADSLPSPKLPPKPNSSPKASDLPVDTQMQLHKVEDSHLTDLELLTFKQVNEYRQKKGLAALKLDKRISQQARAHSLLMSTGLVPFGHEGFMHRVEMLSKNFNYITIAENVALNRGFSDPGGQAFQGWLDSPGHLKNIEGKFEFTGIAVARNLKGEYYFTQIFVRMQRYSPAVPPRKPSRVQKPVRKK